MPWSTADVDKHKKGLSPHQKRVWVAAANNALAACKKSGKEQSFCEGKAVRIANAASGKASKEILMTDEEIETLIDEVTKEIENIEPMHEKGYVPYGITTFVDLDKSREAQMLAEHTYSVTDDFMGLIHNVMMDETVSDKSAVVKQLADQFSSRVGKMPEHEYKSVDTEDAFIDVLDDMAEYEAGVITLDELFEHDGNHVDEPEGEKAKREDVSEADKKRAVAEYGKVTYADSTNKKYPIDSEKHIRAAWSYINMPKNAAKYPDKGAAIKGKVVSAWKRKIDPKGPPQAKKELNIYERIKEAVKEVISPLLPKKEEPVEEKQAQPLVNGENEVMFFKEKDGSMRWLACYSNSIRDDDKPREIISSKSHMRYVDLVDKGQANYPQLWLWHVPEWKFGSGDWVAYDQVSDDTLFTLAAGIVDKGMEPVAEFISQQKGVCLSHGMPVASIRRDESDPTVIVEHITKEISVLPEWAAANKFTSFIVLDDKVKESDMAIPQSKVEALTRVWGEDAKKHLQALEQHNALDAEKATEEGRDTKEVTEEVAVETPAVADAATAETPTEETQYTREEIAEAFANVVGPYRDRVEEIGTKLDQVTAAIEGLSKELSHMKETDTAKIEQVVTQTPAASLAAMIAKSMGMSAVGSPETKVDGRSELGRSHPKEAPANIEQRTGIPFIDKMLADNGASAQAEGE